MFYGPELGAPGEGGAASVDVVEAVATDDSGDGAVVAVDDSPEFFAGAGFVAGYELAAVADELGLAVDFYDDGGLVGFAEVEGLEIFVDLGWAVVAPDGFSGVFV